MIDNINALDEIHKGASMGQDALSYILEMTEGKFKKELLKQFDDYDDIAKEIEKVYKKYNNKSPHDTNIMSKAMAYTGIEMKIVNDKSESKIAQVLLEGNNMGIIEGRKILNNKNLNNEVKQLISKFVNMQEKNVEILKKYL